MRAKLLLQMEEIPIDETIRQLSKYLEHVISINDTLPQDSQVTRFHARTIPSIDIHLYLTRIQKYAPCTSDCFLALVHYLKKMSRKNHQGWVTNLLPGQPSHIQRPGLVINSFNIHRLIIAGMMVAVKFLSDVFYTNVHISRNFF